MQITAPGIKKFHLHLHAWYAKHGRKDLPWRTTRDPYAIYISEIMLQQTQVKTVLERFYIPFLKRFPTLGDLAASEADDVLQAWQGLGYYTRAMNLRAAAKAAGKTLPDTVEGLLALPGIGRNTAHAVCAFAYRKPVAVMEANVKRVLCRIFALEAPKEQELWDNAALLLDHSEPFDYNQAMMDIGAMVCTKRKPHCEQCPANTICQGKKNPEIYPAAKIKNATPVRQKRIAVLYNSKGQYYAQPRSSRFLHGLYHFLETAAGDKSVAFGAQELLFKDGQLLGHIRQQYSHFTLEADIWLMNAAQTGKGSNGWYTFNELQKLPMSMAETKILALIEQAKTVNSKVSKQVSKA